MWGKALTIIVAVVILLGVGVLVGVKSGLVSQLCATVLAGGTGPSGSGETLFETTDGRQASFSPGAEAAAAIGGTVLSADASVIRVRLADGSEQEFAVSDATQLLLAPKPYTASAVPSGSQVTIVGVTNGDGSFSVQGVQVGN